MASLVHNISKGRLAANADRVLANDPANSVFLVIPFTSTDTDDAVRDADTLAALEALALTAEEATWGRKTIDNTGGITVTLNDTDNRVEVFLPDPTWVGVPAANDVTDLEIAYDSDSTGGADANIVPGTWHDFVVETDGSDVTADVPATGFYQAT